MRPWALLLLTLGACERDPMLLEGYGEPIVHSILAAGDSFATVLITTAAPPLDPFSGWSSELPLPNAIVHLTTPGGTLGLTNAPELDRCTTPDDRSPDLRSGCYSAYIDGGIQEGVTYTLEIELPNGRLVRGSAVVPTTPEIIAPESGARLPVVSSWGTSETERLSVRWTNKSPSLHTTIKVASSAALPCYFNLAIDTAKHLFNLTSVTGRDSISLAVMAWFCDPVLFDSPAEIVLTAYNQSYSDYLDRRGASWREAKNSSLGLTGAPGIFAGSASARIPVVLVPIQ